MNNGSTGSSNDSTESAPQLTRRENSPDHSIRADGPVAQGGDATIHDRTGLYLAIIAFGISCMAIGAALILPQLYTARADAQAIQIQMLADRVQVAEREARVMQERWNDLKVELAKRGIPVSDH
jgi:hypothetical protein